jgi:hypothetical protein
MRRLRSALALILAAGLVILAAPGALAAPPDVENIHQTFGPTTVTQTANSSVVCLPGVPLDALYAETATLVVTGHGIIFPDGTGSVHLAIRGDVQLAPAEDLSLPTYTGSIDQTLSGTVSARAVDSETVTTTILLHGSNGILVTSRVTTRVTLVDGGVTDTAIVRSRTNQIC